MPVVCAHALIGGRVQGVSFRYYTYQEALRLGVEGWVRNLHDGRVEAVFQGDRPLVERMLAWCRMGPTGARVEAVEVEWWDPRQDLSHFQVRGTARLG
jgi:acylphosphatase